MNNRTLEWLKLSMIFSAGNHHLWDSVKFAENDPGKALEFVESGKFELTPGEKNMYKKANEKEMRKIVENCRETNTDIISFDDPDYPELLKNIFSPPAVLYFKGCRDVLKSEFSVSVVGTRKPTVYGEKAAYRISNELAAAGFTIISGFAPGIDANAHSGALDAGGRTLAVLGCGTDIDYPKANTGMREKILEKGGFLSEYPPGTPPLGKNFPVRNRLISGLSLGVFTAEAPLKSGALITADMAIEQGRDVFMLPPADIFDDRYKGVVRYLRDGAIPVFGAEDIISEYMSFYQSMTDIKNENINGFISEKTPAHVESNGEHIETNSMIAELLQSEGSKSEIVKLLLKGSMHIDELSDLLDMTTDDVMFELTELEMDGVIDSLPGKMYKMH